jgi:anti-sigma B factor antagonist
MNSTSFATKKVILEPKESITAANANDFEVMLIQALHQSGYSGYLVDMHKVKFLDNAGLMALVSAFRLAKSLGKQLSLCSITPTVQIVFDLTRLDSIFHFVES